MRSSLSVLLGLAVALPAARADELKVNWTVEGIVTGAATLGYVLTETVFKTALAPAECRWCETNALDRKIREELVFDDIGPSHQLSNVTAFMLTPAVAFVLLAGAASAEDRERNWPADAFVVYEAAIVSATLNQIVKFSVARRRPFVEFDNPNPAAASNDENLSFYSGHTNFAFALAVSSGTVASMRGYRGAPAIWGAGLTFALTTGYLRIAADRHYFTDVLTGAVMGSAFGFALPYFLHRDRAAGAPRLGVGPGAVSLSFEW